MVSGQISDVDVGLTKIKRSAKNVVFIEEIFLHHRTKTREIDRKYLHSKAAPRRNVDKEAFPQVSTGIQLVESWLVEEIYFPSLLVDKLIPFAVRANAFLLLLDQLRTFNYDVFQIKSAEGKVIDDIRCYFFRTADDILRRATRLRTSFFREFFLLRSSRHNIIGIK